MLDMFRQLVAVPSVSSIDPRFDQGNRGVIELLATWLNDLDFAVELMPLPGRADKLNLIARRGQGEAGLVLSGHTDTVPFDAGAWTTDPFELIEHDERLYGLGSADMKSFFPLVIEAARGMDLDLLKQPLVILGTADEESTMAGAKALAGGGRQLGRYALIGEPTGLKPVRMHKGILQESIRLRGHSGHASNPMLGKNAIEGMHRVLGELLGWREELRSSYHDPAFEVAEPTLNLGNIHGGDSPNRICADCELQIDLRILPGMPFEEVRSALRAKLARALAGSGLAFETRSLFDAVPPLNTPEGSQLVRVLEKITGTRSGSVAFATEAPYFNALGMETVVCGPGDIAQAHQPDEYVAVARLRPMVELLGRLIAHFCVKGDVHAA